MALVNKTFSDIITFTRASTTTFFNSAGVLTSAATNAPRFDYNPSTLAAQGLLIEESRTNSIRNNTMQGAVAGTPGTPPTNWGVSGTADGIAIQVVGTGTENGITYIDFRYSGTATATSFKIVRFEATNNIVAASGQTWTAATYMRIVAGSTANITGLEHQVVGYTSVGAVSEQTNTPPVLTSTMTRFVTTRALNNATTAFVTSWFAFTFNNGAAIDITLRIGLPQLELGAFATSVIPTTTTALTRAADVASVNTLSPWFNATEGTIYAEFAVTQPVSGGNQFLARFSDNSFNNSIGDNVASTGAAQIVTQSGGVFDGIASATPNVSANTVAKFAGAYATNDLAACINGGTVATDITATIPSGMTRFDLGSDHIGANRIKAGYLRRITYYPRAFPPAQLQALTA